MIMKTIHTTQEFSSLKGSSKKTNCSLRAMVAVLMIIINCNWFHAQTESYTRPSWWFGVVGAANVNFYGGSTQKLNESYTPPVPFHKGLGLGLFGALAIEYYKPGKVFGGMLHLGYDSRKGTFDDVVSPCNCPGELKTKLSYFSIEPSIRIAPFKSNLFFYAGPRIAFNVDHSFVYQLRTNPDYPAQVQGPEVKGNFSDIQSTLISMQVGAGYDVFLRSREHRTQAVLSPFISFHPYFGQDPRSVETWSMTTIRAGAALKFGQGRKIIQPGTEDPVDETPIVAPIYRDSMVELAVNSPKNEPVEGTIRAGVNRNCGSLCALEKR